MTFPKLAFISFVLSFSATTFGQFTFDLSDNDARYCPELGTSSILSACEYWGSSPFACNEIANANHSDNPLPAYDKCLCTSVIVDLASSCSAEFSTCSGASRASEYSSDASTLFTQRCLGIDMPTIQTYTLTSDTNLSTSSSSVFMTSRSTSASSVHSSSMITREPSPGSSSPSQAQASATSSTQSSASHLRPSSEQVFLLVALFVVAVHK